MIVPQFWAEARVRVRANGKQVTVRRFGWSDTDLADAQSMADARAQEALNRIAAGEPLSRRETKRGYNGAEGVPIREEIVERHGPDILTRNSYGSVCLNTPRVLFADIDLPQSAGCELPGSVMLLPFAAVIVIVALRFQLQPLVYAGAAVAVLALYGIANNLLWRLRGGVGGEERRARQRVERFSEQNPAWSIRLYRTPAGLRAVATQRLFDPLEPEVAGFFVAIRVDPLYARMCRNQRCFRARVSPKPWRIGITRHLPRGGPGELRNVDKREAWIAEYERRAVAFASCRFLETLGLLVTHAEVAATISLHDEWCRATSDLPLA